MPRGEPAAAAFDIAWLATLAAVAETGSFTQAGLRLDLTQPAVSQHVAALERWAGTVLVQRRPVALTDAGRVALAHHESLRVQVARLGDDLADLRQGRLGTVRVAAFLSACRTLVPAALTAYRREHPRVRVVLSQLETGPALAALRDRDVDVAVVFGYGQLDVPSPLIPVALYEEPVSLAVPVGHPLADAAGADLSRIDPAEVIAAPDASMPSARPATAARLHYDGDDFSVVLALVAAGHGVAPVPRRAAGAVPPGVVLLPLVGAEPPRRRVWAVSSEAVDRPAVSALVRAFAEVGPPPV